MSSNGGTQESDKIGALVTDLGSKDGVVREHARRDLVAMGATAIDALTATLNSPEKTIRWEGTKALAAIHDPAVVPGLVTSLGDEKSGIRWIAAEGLIALDQSGLEPLLQALVSKAQHSALREGAHHVLKKLSAAHQEVEPVLKALDSHAPAEETPVAAEAALDKLKGR